MRGWLVGFGPGHEAVCSGGAVERGVPGFGVEAGLFFVLQAGDWGGAGAAVFPGAGPGLVFLSRGSEWMPGVWRCGSGSGFAGFGFRGVARGPFSGFCVVSSGLILVRPDSGRPSSG